VTYILMRTFVGVVIRGQ